MTSEPDRDAPPSAGLGSKIRIAARGIASLFRQPHESDSTGVADVVSTDARRETRIPPGQVQTRRWPVLHAGKTPGVDLETWDFRVSGLVESARSWTWPEFRALKSSRVHVDMHCVTRWSLLDNIWEGVLVSDVLSGVVILPEAKFVLVRAENGFTTNLPIVDFLGEDCLFAWSHNGRDLEPDHGWPLRLVVPRLYAWKSAKWVRGVEFLADDVPGFWEANGYHDHGDPWSEQRFW